MKKVIFSLATIIMMGIMQASAQKYFTKNGDISFYSSTPIEKIEAHNKKVSSVLDSKTGNIEFAVLIKAFEFEKALMQEHFNENYLESDKFPKSTFKGSVTNIGDVNFSKDGVYKVKTKGQLTIHGVTKEVSSDGTIEIKGGKAIASSTFNVVPQDYNIEIPKLVKEKIAKEIKVAVKTELSPLGK